MNTRPVTIRTVDVRHRTTTGNRFRFLGRLVGMTALLAIPTGALLAADSLTLPTAWTVEGLTQWGEQFWPILQSNSGAIALVAGLGIVLLWLLVELFGAVFLVTGRRSSIGLNTILQVGLGVALLVIVNVISFGTYYRYDATRAKQFTLAPELAKELKKLRSDSPTTVVVLQLNKSAGILSEESDAYDGAAEQKVVEKVNDLVDELREFGPQFNVVVLNRKDIGFERAVNDLTRKRPGLDAAIKSAPENSIYFYADEKVQSKPRPEGDRLAASTGPHPAVIHDPSDSTMSLVYPANVTRLSFAEFYQLDKTSSKLGGGNLVLLPRGKEAFVRKVLSLEERKPKVGLAVIHPLLTTRETIEEYSAAGMRVALERNGFDVVDVILKRWSRGGPPTPAVTTYEESELERTESRYNLLNLLISDREMAVKLIADGKAKADQFVAIADAAKTDDEKQKNIIEALRVLQNFVRGRISSEAKMREVLRALATQLDVFKAELAEFRTQLAEAGTQYKDVLRNERAVENRRVTDVKTKLKQYVDDCDVLIVPRLTVTKIASGEVIPSPIFNLSKDQAEVVQEFIKAGKPVLFAFGPTITDPRSPGDATDDVERLLPQLGIILGQQTVLTDDDVQAIAEKQGQEFGVSVKLTPLSFDVPEPTGKAPNPITAAFRVTSRAVDRKLEVKQSGYRPFYVASELADKLPFAPEIMHTGPNSFNKDKPLATDDSIPKFEPAKPDDPKRGTRDEERRGPFPVGVAVEVPVPVSWFDGKETGSHMTTPEHHMAAALAMPLDSGLYAAGLTLAAQQVKRPTVRIVALGHGGLFVGKRLDPAHETLLVHTLNWQLHREDRLPHAVPEAEKWSYPRVNLLPSEFRVWRWATFIGLPAVVAYFGLIALMVRKVR